MNADCAKFGAARGARLDLRGRRVDTVERWRRTIACLGDWDLQDPKLFHADPGARSRGKNDGKKHGAARMRLREAMLNGWCDPDPVLSMTSG
eukprot:3337429-Rhodomonas_salina.1